MQIIMFLLSLFLIGCVLYGIASGVHIIQRGFLRLTNSRNDDNVPTAKSASVALPTAEPDNPREPCPEALTLQHNIAKLRELFALFQQGALTQEEFQSMKQRLLAAAQSPPNTPETGTSQIFYSTLQPESID